MTVVFVGGSQRTGTSIAQQMLCQLPDANPYVYEASFLTQLVTCYSQSRNNFSNNYQSYFADVQHLRNFCAGVVHAFLENTQVRLGGVQHLILKEPHLTMQWPFLYELVPEAFFLMMIRDPRDAIASMVDVGRKQQKLGQNYMFTRRDIPELCAHFLSFYEPAFSIKDEGFRQKLGVLHYEELASDPVQAMRDVAKFTGLPFDQIDVTADPDTGHVKNSDTLASDLYSPWVSEVSGKKLSAKRVGRYSEVLSEKEIAIVEAECADFFEWFGYRKVAA